MSETLLVELHIPLLPDRPAPDEPTYEWIDRAYEVIAEDFDAFEHDDGEEFEDEYLFFFSGADEEELSVVAATVASRADVPAGAYLRITGTDADMGTGRRVPLPIVD